jgi:FixJ family two-component response regulator
MRRQQKRTVIAREKRETRARNSKPRCREDGDAEELLPQVYRKRAVTDDEPIVIVIDDDASFLRSTQRLIEGAGLMVLTFPSAEQFLSSALPDAPTCLVLDVHLPDQSGLELQRQLVRVGINVPIIFMTGHGDIPTSVQAMKAGAVEFLTKPFHKRDLFDAIGQALERARLTRAKQTKQAALNSRYAMLTEHQRQVANLVCIGRSNQEIADETGSSLAMVKKHLYATFRKLEVNSRSRLITLLQ